MTLSFEQNIAVNSIMREIKPDARQTIVQHLCN